MRGKYGFSTDLKTIIKNNLTRLNLLLGGLILLLVIGTLFTKISLTNPFDKLSKTQMTRKQSLIRVSYHNPFAKSTQYENPFSDKDNPIADLMFEEARQ